MVFAFPVQIMPETSSHLMHVKVSVDSLLLQPSDNIRQYVNVGLVNLYTLYTINKTMTGAVTDLAL